MFMHADAATQRLQAGALDVAEAGARLTCRLLDFRLSRQTQSEHARVLVAPPLAILSAAVQQPDTVFSGSGAAQHVALPQLQVCLKALSTTIRFLEDPSATEPASYQSCVVAAIEASWPVLQALAASPLAAKPGVSAGVAEVISAAFSAAGDQRGALICLLYTSPSPRD